MEVAAGAFEKQAPYSGQERIAEVFVQRRHRVRLNSAKEPISHDELGAAAQFLEERVERGKIIAVVAITHHDEGTLRRVYATLQRRPIPSHRDRHDARAATLGKPLRSI